MSFLGDVKNAMNRVSSEGEAKNNMCMDIGKYNIFDMRAIGVEGLAAGNTEKWTNDRGLYEDVLDHPPFKKFGILFKHRPKEAEDFPPMDVIVLSEVFDNGDYSSVMFVNVERYSKESCSFIYFKKLKGKVAEHGPIHHAKNDRNPIDEENLGPGETRFFSYLYQVMMPSCMEYINAPTNFIVRESKIRKNKGKKNAHHNRPKYRVLSKNQLKTIGFLDGEGGSKCPHARRGHRRTIQNKHPEWHDGDATRIVWVKPSWIGPDQMDKGGVHYKVLYNL